ncbi:SEL1-like repeat protein [Asticcacaulis tiandongensis]|uniref:SEL1-like repeat protein n=1 Tax=Asticcacaulis tiandongensis TaxID=2565365 RepID=UPI00112666EF|nr:tetratricopeptide repeat protein [Asticcacaulis tiandongensis]
MHIFRHLTGATVLAALCLPLPALSQNSTATGAPSDTTAEVTIVGKKALPSTDPKELMISPNISRSCAFMDDYNPNQDDVMLNYLQSFGHLESEYNDGTGRFRESSPYGDVSRNPNYQSTTDVENSVMSSDDTATISSCGPADRAFAAGRNFIQRNDTTLRDAFTAFDAEDYPAALKLFKAAWDKIGYQNAAFMLGKMHLMGMGTEKNTPEAIKWFKAVANIPFNPQKDRHGFDPENPDYMDVRADAITTLARIYMTGHDVPKDSAEARKWYQKAEYIGFVPAGNTVASMYESGYGGPKDIKRAFKSYEQAAKLGYGPAQYNLGRLYEAGDGVTSDQELASGWYQEAAKNGHAEALYKMAHRYDLGEGGLPHNPETALVYYKEAAIKGQPDALNAIGASFYSGEGLDKDPFAARKWFEQAALRGQPDAMFNLGVMLMNGEGGNVDNAMAYVWFNLAKQSGHENADAALKAMEPKLTVEDRAKAQNLLNPQA